jgi:hypothetical protein
VSALKENTKRKLFPEPKLLEYPIAHELLRRAQSAATVPVEETLDLEEKSILDEVTSEVSDANSIVEVEIDDRLRLKSIDTCENEPDDLVGIDSESFASENHTETILDNMSDGLAVSANTPLPLSPSSPVDSNDADDLLWSAPIDKFSNHFKEYEKYPGLERNEYLIKRYPDDCLIEFSMPGCKDWGLELAVRDMQVSVLSVQPGGSGSKVGVRRGDKLSHIQNQVLSGDASIDEVHQNILRLKQTASDVPLHVVRAAEAQFKDKKETVSKDSIVKPRVGEEYQANIPLLRSPFLVEAISPPIPAASDDSLIVDEMSTTNCTVLLNPGTLVWVYADNIDEKANSSKWKSAYVRRHKMLPVMLDTSILTMNSFSTAISDSSRTFEPGAQGSNLQALRAKLKRDLDSHEMAVHLGRTSSAGYSIKTLDGHTFHYIKRLHGLVHPALVQASVRCTHSSSGWRESQVGYTEEEIVEILKILARKDPMKNLSTRFPPLKQYACHIEALLQPYITANKASDSAPVAWLSPKMIVLSDGKSRYGRERKRRISKQVQQEQELLWKNAKRPKVVTSRHIVTKPEDGNPRPGPSSSGPSSSGPSSSGPSSSGPSSSGPGSSGPSSSGPSSSGPSSSGPGPESEKAKDDDDHPSILQKKPKTAMHAKIQSVGPATSKPKPKIATCKEAASTRISKAIAYVMKHGVLPAHAEMKRAIKKYGTLPQAYCAKLNRGKHFPTVLDHIRLHPRKSVSLNREPQSIVAELLKHDGDEAIIVAFMHKSSKRIGKVFVKVFRDNKLLPIDLKALERIRSPSSTSKATYLVHRLAELVSKEEHNLFISKLIQAHRLGPELAFDRVKRLEYGKIRERLAILARNKPTAYNALLKYFPLLD